MVLAPLGMTGCDSVDYYIESPIDDNGRFVLLNTCRCDIHIQIIHTDLKRNTSIVEKAKELIDHMGKNNQLILHGTDETGLLDPSPHN